MDHRDSWDRTRLASISLAIALLLVIVWQIGQVLLVVFAGVLLATGLSGVANRLAAWLPLGHVPLVILEVVVCLLLLVLVGVIGGAGIARQFVELREALPEGLKTLQESEWALQVDPFLPSADSTDLTTVVLSQLGGAFSSAAGALANVFIILFIGIYGAFEPGVYRHAFLVLVPPVHRERAGEVLDACAQSLRWWLVGRLVSMTAVGVLTAIALAIAGIPLAVVLGLLAGILSFIPYVGPLLAMVPALIVALGEGIESAILVAAILTGVQFVENNLITPLVQRKAVSLPPAALLTAQLLGGVLFGLLGVLLAPPLVVAGTECTRMLYVEDVLRSPARTNRIDAPANLTEGHGEARSRA